MCANELLLLYLIVYYATIYSTKNIKQSPLKRLYRKHISICIHEVKNKKCLGQSHKKNLVNNINYTC